MDIQSIDKNLVVDTTINKSDIVFYDCRSNRFDLYGVIPPDTDEGKFLRIPEGVAREVSEKVYSLNSCTTGGRLRIVTNSPYIAIKAELTDMHKMPHMTLVGSIGFDLYEVADGKEVYYKSFIPPYDIDDGYESVIDFPDTKKRELLINFPLYSGVKKLYIGVSESSAFDAPKKYTYDVPVVYYGSSITHGGCASRPGNSYEQMISRRLDCDYINLGWSGSAKGEQAISDYIAGLKMSVFVYDYDHNAPTPEHLMATHKPMFDTVRRAQPELPIIMLSWTPSSLHTQTDKRFEIIKATYDTAVASGDKNVYLIDGRKIFDGICDDNGTVDGCHPNDWGFSAMAKAIGDVLEKIIVNRAYI